LTVHYFRKLFLITFFLNNASLKNKIIPLLFGHEEFWRPKEYEKW